MHLNAQRKSRNVLSTLETCLYVNHTHSDTETSPELMKWNGLVRAPFFSVPMRAGVTGPRGTRPIGWKMSQNALELIFIAYPVFAPPPKKKNATKIRHLLYFVKTGKHSAGGRDCGQVGTWLADLKAKCIRQPETVGHGGKWKADKWRKQGEDSLVRTRGEERCYRHKSLPPPLSVAPNES